MNHYPGSIIFICLLVGMICCIDISRLLKETISTLFVFLK